MSEFANWGDYFWPGQIDHCRKNLLAEHDPVRLEKFERNFTAARANEIHTGHAEIARTYDLSHLQAIHHHLFQDVYAWAGQLRATELVRPSEDPSAPPHEFVKPDDLTRLAPAVFAQLGDPADLSGQDRDIQVDVLARTYAGLNVLHPFVEGNGRTQRLFLTQAAHAAGLRLDWNQMPHQNQVMAQAFNVGPAGIADALRPCLSAREDTAHDMSWAAITAAAFPQPAAAARSQAHKDHCPPARPSPRQELAHDR